MLHHVWLAGSIITLYFILGPLMLNLIFLVGLGILSLAYICKNDIRP